LLPCPQLCTSSSTVLAHRKYRVLSRLYAYSTYSCRYVHILAYLRSPVGNAPVLPRSAQLTSSSSSRLDALLELRDEAAYLGLDELVKLSSDELSLRHRSRLQARSSVTRPGSTASGLTHVRTRSEDSVQSLATISQVAPVPEEETVVPQAKPEPIHMKPVPLSPKAVAMEIWPSPSTPEATTTSAASKSRTTSMKSNKSLYDLYARSPTTTYFSSEPAALSSANTSTSTTPAPRIVGLHQRMASRTQSENRGFNSMKTRPTAQWI
jgi:hypothetical protein